MTHPGPGVWCKHGPRCMRGSRSSFRIPCVHQRPHTSCLTPPSRQHASRHAPSFLLPKVNTPFASARLASRHFPPFPIGSHAFRVSTPRVTRLLALRIHRPPRSPHHIWFSPYMATSKILAIRCPSASRLHSTGGCFACSRASLRQPSRFHTLMCQRAPSRMLSLHAHLALHVHTPCPTFVRRGGVRS